MCVLKRSKHAVNLTKILGREVAMCSHRRRSMQQSCINRCRDYWQLIGSVLESKEFTTNMRIAFKTKGDQAMNKSCQYDVGYAEFSERRE